MPLPPFALRCSLPRQPGLSCDPNVEVVLQETNRLFPVAFTRLDLAHSQEGLALY